MFDNPCYSPFPYDKSLILWLTQMGESGTTYYIVSDAFRRKYYLWKEKKKTRWESDNPMSLYPHIK